MFERTGGRLTAMSEETERKRNTAPIALWIWRVVNTALIAFGVWGLWWQAVQLEVMNGELINLIDYLSVIAERTG